MNHKNVIKKPIVGRTLPLPKGVKVIKGSRNPKLRKWIDDRDISASGGCHTVHRQFA